MKYQDAIRARREIGSLIQVGSYATGYRGQRFGGVTGTIAAGLAANATIAAWRYPAVSTGIWFLSELHVHYACLTTLTAPISASRRLALRRGAGASPSGGADLDVARSVSSEATESLVVGKIATTAALTMSGITLETPAIARLLLATYGTAGQDYDEIWQFDGEALLPGELFALTAPQAFDAAGTWQASIKGFGFEVKVP